MYAFFVVCCNPLLNFEWFHHDAGIDTYSPPWLTASRTDLDGLARTVEVALVRVVCGVDGVMDNFFLVGVVVDALEFTEGAGDVMFSVFFAFAVFGVLFALACRSRSLAALLFNLLLVVGFLSRKYEILHDHTRCDRTITPGVINWLLSKKNERLHDHTRCDRNLLLVLGFCDFDNKV